MKRKDWLEFIATMVSVGVVWYMQEERPAPVPAFWWYVSRESRKVATYADWKYRQAIERVY